MLYLFIHLFIFPLCLPFSYVTLAHCTGLVFHLHPGLLLNSGLASIPFELTLLPFLKRLTTLRVDTMGHLVK